MNLIKQAILIHRIEIDKPLLDLIVKFEELATGALLEDIAEGGISAGLDEQVFRIECNENPATAERINKATFLAYCEKNFWRSPAGTVDLAPIVEIVSELYDTFNSHAEAMYTLMKQAVNGYISNPDEVYSIENVDCIMTNEHMDVRVTIQSEPS